jgi:hypothetical protein
MSQKPLNPELHARLSHIFGGVSIINQGVPASIRFEYTPIIGQQQEVRWWIPEDAEKGEQYAVKCPFCRDKGRHLYISHTSFMIPANPRVSGIIKPGPLLANCFHGCLNNHPERLKQISDKISDIHAAAINYPTEAPEERVQYSDDLSVSGIRSWCHSYSTLDTAPEMVLKYIEQRGYTKEYLSSFMIGWGPVKSTNTGTWLNNGEPFLIIPIAQNGILRGFQARAIGTKDELERRGMLRWYIHPGLRKTSVLYNIDRASNYPICVLTEGVFGVLRIGPCGIATFGHTPSSYQQKLMSSRWSRGALVWLPDTNISKDLNPIQIAREIAEKWNSQNVFALGAHVVTLPAKDPDELPTADIWAEIGKQTGNLFQKIWKS